MSFMHIRLVSLSPSYLFGMKLPHSQSGAQSARHPVAVIHGQIRSLRPSMPHGSSPANRGNLPRATARQGDDPQQPIEEARYG